MSRRQRLVIHLHGDHRLARRVHHPGDRHAGGEAIDRPTDELRRRLLNAGHLEHVAQPNAGPLGVPDEVPADLVADTRDRDVLLEHGQSDQLVPRQGRLAVNEPVDPQLPGGRIDRRGQQRGIDPVEAVVRHDDGGQPRDRACQVLCRIQRLDQHRRRRDGGRGTGRGDPLPLEQVSADEPGHDGRSGHGTRPDHERSARPVGHDSGGGGRASRRAARQRRRSGAACRPEEPSKGPHADPDRDRCRGRFDAGVGQRIIERGGEPEDAECREDRGCSREVASREDAETGPDRRARSPR